MVNTEKFAVRLEQILKFYDLSAASFADKIEVGRSSISHILSGRNKPSLDFVMKVVTNFPEVELYWLLNGKGKFPKDQTSSSSPTSNYPKSENQNISVEKNPPQSIQSVIPTREGKQIRKIVIFYEDGTFEAFEN